MPATSSTAIARSSVLVSVALAAVLLSACGDERRYGDAGARPVDFTVHLERQYIRNLADRHIGVGFGAGGSWSSNGSSGTGMGIGLTFAATTVTLYGGDGVAESQVFQQELKWGDNSFAVPLAPGRVIYLMVRAEGGHEGWESIGNVTVPSATAANPAIIINLAGSGRSIATNPPSAPAPDATATGAATADASATAPALAPPAEPSQAPAVRVEPAPAPPAVAPAHTFPDPTLDNR
jgi:hypothetical protein